MTDPGATLIVEFAVKGMTCASCSARLERALRAKEGVVSAEVQLVTERATIEILPGITREALIQAVRDTGFEATPLKKGRNLVLGDGEEESFMRSSRRDGWLLLGSAVLSAPLVVPMLLMPFAVHWKLPSVIELALATVVQFALGARFYVAGAKAIRHGSGNMDLLVAIGTSAAYFYSVAMVLGSAVSVHAGLYFEASAVVITLVRFGKWLEAKAKRGTTAAMRSLASLQPERVLLRRQLAGESAAQDGVNRTFDEEVPLEAVEPGCVIVVRPGERFATDGIILDGIADVDESMITGETEPVTKGARATVVAGSMNTNGLVIVQATNVGEDSTLGRIIALVYGAQSGKAKVQRLVDRVAAVFVPTVLAVAAVTFLGWVLATGELRAALVASVSVLVIACPCALGLATPTAIVAGMGAAARAGILIRDIDTLERAGQIDLVVFDKTGTLTQGTPEVTQICTLQGTETALLQLAATVEQGSLHPLAKATHTAASERAIALLPLRDFESHAGNGVQGVVDGRVVRVGSLEWLAQCGVATQKPVLESVESHVEIAVDNEHLGTLYVADKPRKNAVEGIRALKRAGIRTAMLSGDREAVVYRFAKDTGLDEAFGGVRPEEKQERIRQFLREGRKVAMVGDGINDAPALAAADVGIAMGTGTQVAMQTAGVVLMRPDPTLVFDTIELARATFWKIRQNLFWAFIYNCIGIPLAAAGRLSPMVAGLAMALSSVSVVSNSLLLRRWRPRKDQVASGAS